MSSGRSSGFVIIARMFTIILIVTVGSSYFWNGLSGRNMFPLDVAVLVAFILTGIFAGIGWVFVTLGSNALLGNDQNFREWKQRGGRPYLDSLPKPINPDSNETREMGP